MNTKVVGNSTQKVDGEQSISVTRTLNITTDDDANMEAGGAMIIASQKKMNLKSNTRVDIAKG